MSTDTLLEVSHLSKSFGDNAVLRDIDFSVRKGALSASSEPQALASQRFCAVLTFRKRRQGAKYCSTARILQTEKSKSPPTAQRSAWSFRASIFFPI